MILILHPQQVQAALDLAADLNLDPQTVAENLFGYPCPPLPKESSPSPASAHPSTATAA